ncbi:MAG: M2 family metallopeptidase [Armatimonadota bacterium]
MSRQFSSFLASLRTRVEPLEVESSDAWWQANLSASPETEERASASQKALTRLYADRAAFAELKQFASESLDSEERRQHTLLVNAFTGNQMDDAVIEEMVDTERRVENAYNSFRPSLRGVPTGDNALRDILRDSDDSELRRDAWTASKEIGGEVEKDVLRLVEMRNAESRRLGYANYYQMALSLQELDQENLFALLKDVAEQTDPLYKEYKATLDAGLAERFGISTDALRPWHYSDPFFQDAPSGEVNLDHFFTGKDLEALTRDYFDAIGLDVRDILARSDLYERENKCQHAFCVHVGRYDDIRVLCNCTDSERWMGTMLHEFGHAVYDKYLGADLPFFLRDAAHTLTTEAIAMLLGRLSRNAAWLSRYGGVDAEEAKAVEASAASEQSAQLLVFARWCLVMTHFERALYENPTQDLNALWWEIVQRFQGITAPENRDAPDWAAKLHMALAPVYYQNYLLGEMYASQLLNYLRSTVLPDDTDDKALVSSPAVGAYLTTSIFEKGMRLPWNELIATSTGEPLNPAHFVGHIRL